MKNKIFYIITFTIILLVGVFISCNDEKLDIAPLDIITADQVFKSESAITAYMASLYDGLPMNFDAGAMSSSTDESYDSYMGSSAKDNIADGTWTQWWGYSEIRNINDFIEKLTTSDISENLKNYLIGEAKFLKAYCYFSMVKRYGGVPIIKEVLYYTGDNLEELQVARSTEKEVYDFIATDLDEAVSLLPEANAQGRATKYMALALKSRAMLYAASIAKYSSVMLDGVVGIPSSDANEYWQASFDAAELVINRGIYSLYNKNPNKEENFAQLFLDKDNPEAIFTKYFSYPDKTHNYDRSVIPFGVRGPDGYSSGIGPTLDMVMQFENIDGTPFVPEIGTLSAPVFYTNPTDLYLNTDPRLLATVIVPFAKWKGVVIDVQAGLYDQGVKVEAGDYSALYNVTTHQVDNVNGTLHVVGLSGLGGSETTRTGFFIRKYMDPTLERSLVRTNGSSQAWIEIRYAEVLLNYAEAAIELNNISDAKWAINQIRDRAGIKLLDDNEVTIERVRHERLVELAFENHRWWDYRRWRKADVVLNNTWLSRIKPYYDIQENAYRFETDRAMPLASRTFNPKVYYEMLDPSDLAKNKNLIQNPNY